MNNQYSPKVSHFMHKPISKGKQGMYDREEMIVLTISDKVLLIIEKKNNILKL